MVLKNYKSIRECDVTLGPITFLVGPNGAGKSNFVEALRFLSYALATSLEQALDARQGFRSILRDGANSSSGITLEIFFRLASGESGRYLLQIGAEAEGPIFILREECDVDARQGTAYFRARRGAVTSNQGIVPAASEDKLYLVNASGLQVFEPVYRALSRIAVYNPVPDEIRRLKPERRYRSLDRSGSALAETIYRLSEDAPERLRRVIEFLRKITPGLRNVRATAVDSNYDLRFEFTAGGTGREDLPSQNASDGTLRALAVLVALYQTNDRYALTLTGVEEPEAGLHPAAAGVLFDALMEASQFGQVVVTSHSPDLLDREDVPEEAIQAVEMWEGRTIIGRVDNAGRFALQERLYTAGELMRMNQLRPEGAPDFADAR